jgi:iron complex outermembrane receptor protein
MLGGWTVRGNVGIRYAKTEVTSKGWQTVTSGTPPVVSYNYVTAENDYEDVLPSFNLVFEPRDNLVLRLGAAKVMSRPTLGDLTPGGSVAPTTRTVSYGNPLLNPFRATNYDASVEWYFGREALLAVAVFHKDIDSFITSETVSAPYNTLGLPLELLQGAAQPTDLFLVTRRLNGEGGKLDGIEIQYQQPFTFLPGPWSHFGFTGNVTWVDSDVSYGATAGRNRLTGQSKNTANATLYYETDRFQARVSAAYRSQYLVSFPGSNGNSEEGVNDATNIDASMSYDITDSMTVSLEGINLTDEYTDRYVDITDRVSDYRHTGREVAVGLRWKY